MRPVWPLITPEKSMAPLHHFFLLLHSHYLPLPSLSPGCAHRSCPMPHARRRCPHPHLATASRQRHRGLHPSAGFMHSALSSRSSLRLLSSPFIPRLFLLSLLFLFFPSLPFLFFSFLRLPPPSALTQKNLSAFSVFHFDHYCLFPLLSYPLFVFQCAFLPLSPASHYPPVSSHMASPPPPPPPASILHDRSTRSLSPLSLLPHPPRPSRY